MHTRGFGLRGSLIGPPRVVRGNGGRGPSGGGGFQGYLGAGVEVQRVLVTLRQGGPSAGGDVSLQPVRRRV